MPGPFTFSGISLCYVNSHRLGSVFCFINEEINWLADASWDSANLPAREDMGCWRMWIAIALRRETQARITLLQFNSGFADIDQLFFMSVFTWGKNLCSLSQVRQTDREPQINSWRSGMGNVEESCTGAGQTDFRILAMRENWCIFKVNGVAFQITFTCNHLL